MLCWPARGFFAAFTPMSAPQELPQLPALRRRRRPRARVGQVPSDREPFHRTALGADRARRARRRAGRGGSRQPRVRKRAVAAPLGQRARPPAVEARRPGAAQRGRAGRDRAARQRQARDRGRSPRCATWATTSSTTPASPTRCRARSSRPTRRACSAYTRYEPKGVVAIITPWNSPLTLTSWKLAPALAAGCTAVIKPSEFTSASILEFAALFAQAGLSQGRGQRGHRPRARGRRGAGHPSQGRARRLHRRRGGRPQGV